jgi:rhodanese-related sulfurtransferase
VPTQSYTDITLADLDALRHQPSTVVVDVRDEWEFDEFNIGGVNLPLPDLRSRKSELLPFDTVIVICTNGVRSRVAAKDILRQPELQRKAIYHLHGGIIEAED